MRCKGPARAMDQVAMLADARARWSDCCPLFGDVSLGVCKRAFGMVFFKASAGATRIVCVCVCGLV